MGKLVSGFFGSKGGNQSIADPGAMEAWNIAKPTFNYLNSTGVDFTRDVMANPAYTGQRVADLNPFQINSAMNFGNLNDATGTLGSLAQFTSGLNNLSAGNQFGSNAADLFRRFSDGSGAFQAGNDLATSSMADGLVDAAGRDVTRNLFEQQLPGIDRAAAGSGNINSTRAGVETAIARRGAADRLTDLSTNIRSSLFDKGVNQFNQNLTNALGANNQLLQSGNFGINALGSGQSFGLNAFTGGQQAGGVFQNQDQNVLDANRAVFDESFANRLAALQALGGIAGATKAQTSAGISQASPSMASQIGGLLMGAGTAAKGFGWSDIRVKENISKIGQLDSGINVYSFEYKPEFKDIAGHGKFIGVMAHEVEHIPGAVAVHSNGYKMVDYSKVR